MRILVSIIAILLVFAGCNSLQTASTVDCTQLPRVLLIGDSISMGYTITVREELADVAVVHRIPRNGGSTVQGLKSIDNWLGDIKWDVICFNFGLHDLKRLKNGKYDIAGEPVATPQQYAENLEKLIKKLKPTNAKLIWATTTPVPAGAIGRIKGSEIEYNQTAKKVMQKNNVAINDLYKFTLPILDKIQRPNDVHFTKNGYKLLGRQVAKSIRKALQ